MNATQYVYTKERKEFGRQCLFTDRGPDIIDNYPATSKFQNKFILKDPCCIRSQCSTQQAVHEINTIRAEFTNTMTSHTEGGWPESVNVHDEEQPKRYKRKIEREDNYVNQVSRAIKGMENCILQNNAINIYQQYFADLEAYPSVEKTSARTINIFKDDSYTTRPINNISWSPDAGRSFAASYCNLNFQNVSAKESTHSYIWEVENPNKPFGVLKPDVQLCWLEYHQKDPNLLASGMYNGLVAVWDLRDPTVPSALSALESSHREPAMNVLWINSKTGTEFFSSSTDGQIKWWDTRNLSDPYENLIIDSKRDNEQSVTEALGVSALEYETTIPTRFMIGTEHGIVHSCNRKGKTAVEKLGFKFVAHNGPIYSVSRNPYTSKNFLTVGDWSCKIWSEECKESAVIWTSNYKVTPTAGAWSPTRFSTFFVTTSEGVLEAWDLLQTYKHATLGVKVCDVPLTTLRAHEDGKLIAIGNNMGTVYLVELSDNLVDCNKTERALLTALFERESRREKILETRTREIRLKLAQQKELEEHMKLNPVVEEEPQFVDAEVRAAEKEFFYIVDKELGLLPPIEDEEEEDEEEQEDEETEEEPPPPPPPEPEPAPKKKGKGKK